MKEFAIRKSILRHSRMLLAGISLVKHRFPIELVPTLDWVDFGNDVFLTY
jgi:hypothetical protein